MSKSSTFTIRISPDEHETLNQLAGLRHKTVSDLARQFISEGIGRALDPDEIDRMLEEERARLKKAAAEVRERAGLPPIEPAGPSTRPAEGQEGGSAAG